LEPTRLIPIFAQIAAPLAEDKNSLAGGSLGNTPYWVLGGYLLLLLVLGIAGWLKSTPGEEDYYLAGRRQGWFVSSLTIMATFFSSFALLGAPGMVYREGVVFALFSLNVPVAGLSVYLLGARIWKLGRKFRFVTPGDLVADFYGNPPALRLLVALAGFLYVIPYIVMQIQAGGLISQELFGEGSFTIGASVLAAVTMLYIMVGGMRSVAWTDLIQGILLITGMLVSGLAMLFVFGGAEEFGSRIVNDLPETSLVAPGNTGTWTWTMLLSICLLGSTGSMIQPAQWMRFYSADSALTLKRGAVLFAVVLTTCFLLGVMLIGLAGQVLYPLTFSYEVAVKDGPSQLSSVPAGLAEHFRYVPPIAGDSDTTGQLVWEWSGRNRPELTSEDTEQLRTLADGPVMLAAIDKLSSTVAEGLVRPSVTPHPQVDPDPTDSKDFDAILVTVLNKQLPAVFGQFGALFASLIVIAIMAASMSTADSNLHALSAVLTRDIYDQFINPGASERQRVWVGRIVIFAATMLALGFAISARRGGFADRYDFLKMIAQMGLMAIAFSAQLLPITIDILFLQKGTGRGATIGLAAGLFGAFLFGPLFALMVELIGNPSFLVNLLAGIGTINASLPMHGSVWGLALNVPLFVLVSYWTQSVPQERKQLYRQAMR